MNKQTQTYLTRQEVISRYKISNTTLYRWMQEARVKFPKPVAMGPRCVRWKIAEIEIWEEQRQKSTV